MKTYVYDYQTLVTFSEPIADHQVMIRCQPAQNDFQQIMEEHLILPPYFRMQKSTDVFGNRIIYGGTRDSHTTMVYISTGIVRSHHYAIRSEVMRPFYGMSTPLTASTAEMEELLPSSRGRIDTQALDICHSVHEAIAYEPFTTDNNTTAAEVMQQRKGVCQDMAHLMISLCRMRGITARYVNGFLDGTGVTHAWVEVACTDAPSTVWIGFDPTHDRLIDYGYIKLAHGRDASDCTVNRGTYLGNVAQQTQTLVTVKEI